MDLYSIIAFVLFAVGIPMALGVTPEGLVSSLLDIMRPKTKLRYMVENVRDSRKRRRGRLFDALMNLQAALEGTGKGRMFPIAIFASIVMFVTGYLIAMMLDNPWLVPTLATGLAAIPLSYINKTITNYHHRTKEELETALSIITNTYLRTDNIITAVEENIEYIKPPLKRVFQRFVTETNFTNANTKSALYNLRDRIDDLVFYEWVSTLIQCQDDRNLKENLLPIVSKLTDIRLVNSQIQNMLNATKMEYFAMLGILAGSVPLLYFLNIDWFNTLIYHEVGKFTQGIISLIALITYFLMVRYTQPVDYSR